MANGQDDWEPEIDLHGLTVDKALKRLHQELYMARARGARSAIVITGRGFGSHGGNAILRPAIETWLRGADGQQLGVHSLQAISKGGALRFHIRAIGS
ncbi:MAG: Smr/MutS family protein [Planctomycetota bacterium]|nr:Smr/MutS family protein [Planctomycetota bacterium]